ncbi:hypothetical protein PSAB6_410063 [Paraburkholderia sabiae]|nr:hypothetical protein PSAB6_410063 [Paraburkholderia sabiae]
MCCHGGKWAVVLLADAVAGDQVCRERGSPGSIRKNNRSACGPAMRSAARPVSAGFAPRRVERAKRG